MRNDAFKAQLEMQKKMQKKMMEVTHRYQGVTLGALSTRGGQALRGVKRHPTIHDNVTIYSGASVLGGDTVICEGAVINSNVFVTQSVPPHTRVSTKNPELQYRDKKPTEFKQELNWDYSI